MVLKVGLAKWEGIPECIILETATVVKAFCHLWVGKTHLSIFINGFLFLRSVNYLFIKSPPDFPFSPIPLSRGYLQNVNKTKKPIKQL